jgi:hypothetical protein
VALLLLGALWHPISFTEEENRYKKRQNPKINFNRNPLEQMFFV